MPGPQLAPAAAWLETLLGVLASTGDGDRGSAGPNSTARG
jgi:hypothetical protein